MVKITKVYTRAGDDGTTALADGKRIKKTSQKIVAIGAIDELNSYLGWIREAVGKDENLKKFDLACLRIQHELFDLGAQLSVPKALRKVNTPTIMPADIEHLEKEIDEWNEKLSSLNSFILPGGGEMAARIHIARAVCRRAEIELLRCSECEVLDGIEAPYLNRLSDWLFVAARYVAKQSEETENLWQPGLRDAVSH